MPEGRGQEKYQELQIREKLKEVNIERKRN